MDAEAKSKNQWFHFSWQIIVACFCVYWYFNPPAPNKAVLALALVTVLMALYEMRTTHRAIYLALVLVLVFIENRAIDKDHEGMAKIFGGIEQSVQRVFEKTQQAADTATDAVNTITGGKGFCYIDLGTIAVFGKKTDRLAPMLTV